MFLHCRLFTRIKENASSFIECKKLFATYILECTDNFLKPDVTQRELSYYVMKIFSNAKRKTMRQGDGFIHVYYGIELLPLGPINTDSNSVNMQIISNLIPDFFSDKEITKECLTLSCKTEFCVNGHSVIKLLTFKYDGTFEVNIGGKEVDLNSHHISNTYNKDNIETICRIVKSMQICQGVVVSVSVVCSRYHTVEILKDCNKDVESRIVRSLNCRKILNFNSIIKTCHICKHMTFQDKTNNKENQNADSKASSYTCKLSDNNLKEEFRKLIPNASNNMLELLICHSKNDARDPRGRRWSKEIINSCLQLYTRSPSGYNHLRASKLLDLPSPKILILYKSTIKHKAGFQDEVFR